jgi:hypothetical protein
MAHLKRVRIRGRTYYYVVKSVRRGDEVSKKVLEYLGADPSPARLKRALTYWGVKAKLNARKGGR